MHTVRVNLATETYDVDFWRSHAVRPGVQQPTLWGVPKAPGAQLNNSGDALHQCIDAHISRAVDGATQSRHLVHLIDNIRTLRIATGRAGEHPGFRVDRAKPAMLEALQAQLETLADMGRCDPLLTGAEFRALRPGMPLSPNTLNALRRQCSSAVEYYAEVTEAARALQRQSELIAQTCAYYRPELQALAAKARDALADLVQTVLMPDAERLEKVASHLAGRSEAACFAVLTAHVSALQSRLQGTVYPAVADALCDDALLHRIGKDFLPVMALALANTVLAMPRLVPCALGAVTVGAALTPTPMLMPCT